MAAADYYFSEMFFSDMETMLTIVISHNSNPGTKAVSKAASRTKYKDAVKDEELIDTC